MNLKGDEGAKERCICNKDRGVTYKTVLTNSGGKKTKGHSCPNIPTQFPKSGYMLPSLRCRVSWCLRWSLVLNTC